MLELASFLFWYWKIVGLRKKTRPSCSGLSIITQSIVQNCSAYSLPDYKVTYGIVGQRLSCELCRDFPRIAEIDGGKLQRPFSFTKFDYFQRSSHVQP